MTLLGFTLGSGLTVRYFAKPSKIEPEQQAD